MSFQTLISTFELAGHLNLPDWAIIDCRFALAEPARGRRDYLAAHIPGAVYAHLEEDLSGAIVPGRTGRHPLPNLDDFARRLAAWGIAPGVQVVAYDDDNGSMAARLWWLLRWAGHDDVAVLDGGWAAWQAEGRPTRIGTETREPRDAVLEVRNRLVADADDVAALTANPTALLIDARSRERFRGEQEPIDPVAGHIPGAICAPFSENLDRNGRFRPANELRARFRDLLGDAPTGQAIFYCGSGVTAAHNLLALAHAGLGDARLYPGSWSEWITDPARPVAREA
jgi:thiosulfate/3-mercaptopyruvate sulfurtransferase